jgi:hypothetical protein
MQFYLMLDPLEVDDNQDFLTSAPHCDQILWDEILDVALDIVPVHPPDAAVSEAQPASPSTDIGQ